MGETVLDTYTDISSSQSVTIQHTGFLCGTAQIVASGGEACLIRNSQRIAGWAWCNVAADQEISFCVPLEAGSVVWAQVSGGGKIKDIQVLEAKWPS